jgi:hypothetical protein
MTRTLICTMARGLRRFVRNARGTITIEAVVMFPVLFFTMLSMLVIFDAYRQTSMNVKAAFTISDMISREITPINGAYMDGFISLFQELARSDSPPRLRVTVVYYDLGANRLYLEWSHQRGGVPVLTDADIPALTPRVPFLWDGERLIIVETWSNYKPPFNVGIEQQDLYNFVFTRLRFVPQLKFEV